MVRLARCCIALLIVAASVAATAAGQTNWVTSWAASVQGPYPVGNPSAQPNLSLVFPAAETGARDQSFRLIVKPEFWGAKARMRFSNALGTQPVTFDGAYAGLQWSGSAVMPGTNRAITFGGKPSVTVAPREKDGVRGRSVLRRHRSVPPPATNPASGRHGGRRRGEDYGELQG